MTKRGTVKVLLAVLAIVGAITAMAYKEKQATIKYQRECQENVSQILTRGGENDKARADECKDAKDYMPWWYVLIAWPDGITVWAILATLGMIGWQSYETRRAANLQRDKDRARLFVHPHYEGSFDFERWTSELEQVAVRITNVGITRAFNVRVWANVVVAPTKRPPSLPRNTHFLVKSSDEIKESGERIESQGLPFPFKEVDWDAIRSGQSFVHFFGRVTYDDVFGQAQWTTFRYIWAAETQMLVDGNDGEVVSVTENAGGWELHGSAKDNYRT